MRTVVIDSDELAPELVASAIQCAAWYVTQLGYTDVVLTNVPTADAFGRLHFTEKFRHVGADGYHTVEAGVPTSYISVGATGGVPRLHGYYAPAHWSKALWNLARTKITKAAVPKSPARYSAGAVTVLCHELAELLADSNIATYVGPDPDGKKWLLEPCDWVFPTYLIHTVGANVVVFPNSALPVFWTTGAKGPYDLCGLVTAPWQMTPKGYNKKV